MSEIFLKHAELINKAIPNYKAGMDIINPDNGIILNKAAKFDMNLIEKGAENELWSTVAYSVPALGRDTPVLNVCARFDNGDNSDTLHVPTVTSKTPVTTLEGGTPNNSDSAFAPGVVDINTKNQTNTRWSFTTKQLRSMSFNLMSDVMKIHVMETMREIQTQVLIIANEGAASAHRQERASGDAMTLALLTNAWQYLMDDGADASRLYMTADPATIGKIGAIAEATSGNSIFQRYDYSQQEYLAKGIIGEVLGMKVLRTLLPTQDDDWDGRETGVFCQTCFDASGLIVGINNNYSVLDLPVLANPGRQYNLQVFWGAGVLNANMIAPIKMYEA